jgi:hypothetical protein
MPICTAFSDGAAFDAVLGHRDDLAVRLQRLDDVQLLLGQAARRSSSRRCRSCLSSIRSRLAPAITWPGSKPAALRQIR